MLLRICGILLLAGCSCLVFLACAPVEACAPAPASWANPVVNADQTVIILWDEANKMQHFIRQATFKSDADDFGFLIPSPTPPELSESGDAAFPFLRKLTEPEVKKAPFSPGIGCTCSSQNLGAPICTAPPVTVLQEKLVAGFHAAVLETKSSDALVQWLKDNGYSYSPEIAAWAKPYVEQGWKITALKIAKSKDAAGDRTVSASALRMSFRTEKPLFPYREPDNKDTAVKLGARRRLLRIYFIAESRYEGGFPYDFYLKGPHLATMMPPPEYVGPWTGKVAWAGRMSAADRKQLLEHLKLPETTGPAQWWLTEFEDNWPYKLAPQDVYFQRAAKQEAVRRPATFTSAAPAWPTDVTTYALAAVIVMPALVRLRRRWRT